MNPEHTDRGWQAQVLVVEDDASMGKVIRFNLEEQGHRVILVDRGDDAIGLLSGAGQDDPDAIGPYDLVVTDFKLPGADGMDVLRAAKQAHPDTPVILVTAFGSVDKAIDAMAAGAADYITKPFRRQEFKARISQSLDRARLKHENEALRAQVERSRSEEIVTASPRMQQLLKVLERVAASDATVLLTGESGTGKELAARLLHRRSPRSAGPFVPVNCAALPGELLENELFGHESGAFTGAARSRRGKFEQADAGTLFLDEIGELPVELQSKILRVLEEGVIDRLGGAKSIKISARVVVATNRDLQAEVEAGRFRADLYHRIGVVPVELPPLRERPEDIPLLVKHFVVRLAPEAEVRVAPALMQELNRRIWPGNVRELKNLVERMVLLRESDVLDIFDLAPPGAVATGQVEPQGTKPAGAPTPPESAPLRPDQLVLPEESFSLPKLEREIILKALAMHGNNRSATARYLQVPRHVLLYRLNKYDQEE